MSSLSEGRNRDWYKRMSFYQIWIRSFADGNGEMQDTELHGRSHEDTDSEE